jgi:hypothetical protein
LIGTTNGRHPDGRSTRLFGPATTLGGEILKSCPKSRRAFARDRVRDLADEVAQVVVADVAFVHLHEHDDQHAARRREVDESGAPPRDVDDARVIGNFGSHRA